MKKAILIICVLSVLALLAVPVMAEVLLGDSDLDRQMAPSGKPGTFRRAEVELDRQIGSSPPRPPGKNRNHPSFAGGARTTEGDLDQLAGGRPRPPSKRNSASASSREAESPALIAFGGRRSLALQS